MSASRCGLLILHKPAGITSFRSLGAAKKAVETKKVGHTGTLDKFASGVLPALVGPASRFSSFFMDLPKTYRAVVRIGLSTDTLDPEGEISERGPIPAPEELRQAALSFVGSYDQLPPDFSALHVAGQRASDLARQGKKPELKPRKVSIYDLQVHRCDGDQMEMEVHCSRGTYIRALARDIAAQLGTVAYLTALERSSVGSFTLEHAVDPDQIVPERDLIPIEAFVDKLSITTRKVKSEYTQLVLEGGRLHSSMLHTQPTNSEISALLDTHGEFLALSEYDGAGYSYRFVRPRSNPCRL